MHDLSSADLAQLAAVGISPDAATAQLAQLRNPPAPVRLLRPATIGDGIERASEAVDGLKSLMAAGDAVIADGRVTKFVPASGAASRMFKQLLAALHGHAKVATNAAAAEFFERLDDFPFSAELRERANISGAPADDAEQRHLLRVMLEDMGLASLPKALVPFHRSDRVRTAFEEQLLEGVRYTGDSTGAARLHFTIPAQSHSLFSRALDAAQPYVALLQPDVHLSVDFSVQSPSTDTLALDHSGAPLRSPDGTLQLRPSGHGALLTNLQHSGGDIVVVKNIDNILPAGSQDEVVEWKRILIGRLAQVQAGVFSHIRAITAATATGADLAAARQFIRDTFAHAVSDDAGREALMHALHRPLRVCGVVRNDGEPGGAPFWVRGADGAESIQIVERAQVDPADAGQQEIFRQATHFNPVDLVCGLRDHTGTTFDLSRFVDTNAAFVTRKSANGRTVTALERPGLWNGSMAGWNTICVEVPASTFAPVKTVFDLLRPQHQSAARV